MTDKDSAPPALEVDSENAQTSEDGRSRWSSRWAFWLAAVGSAVGLGNLWRFPWQCATWGGGPFLIAYIFCLITIGMPILTQELALGQKHRSGDIESFGRMNWRLRGIGLASVIGTFGILTYYSVVIGMSLVFLFASMQKNLPYDAEHADWWTTDVMIICSYPPTDACAAKFAWELWLATLLVFVITYFCVWKGVLSASNVVKFTMPVPLLFLLILLVRTAFLKGAGDGIGEYLDFTDWSELSKSGVWDAAVGQCFFSLSVCMGVMTAYGSYNPIKQDVATDEKVISMFDLTVSLFAGFVVYTVLGFLEATAPLDEGTWYTTASFGLVFSAYPAAIAEFGAAEQLFGVLFFLVLFLLGIDSLFSMVEGLSTVIVDSDVGRQFGLNAQVTSAAICAGGALCSLLYCFGSGIYMLDIVDRYVNNYGMVFLGICETVACGWFYGLDRQESRVGKEAIDVFRIGFFISWGISVILAGAIENNGDVYGVVVFIVLIFGSFGFAQTKVVQPNDKEALTTVQQMWYIMGWEGSEELRDFMNGNVPSLSDNWLTMRLTCNGECTASYRGVSIVWGFLIKYFIPVFLSFILLSTIIEDTKHPYSGYEWGDLAIGIVVFSSMVIIVAVIALFPQLLKQTSDESGLSPTGQAVDNKNNKLGSPKRVKTHEPDDDGGLQGKTLTTDDGQAVAVAISPDDEGAEGEGDGGGENPSAPPDTSNYVE